MISLDVNGRRHELDVSPEMPLLWVLRDTLGLTGTKFGCGLGQCGACTVHVDGAAVRACLTAVSTAVGKKITTIEGLSPTSTHPLQVAWVAEQVPQCGYCQSGQIMAAAALLRKNPRPTDKDIDDALPNLCRRGTYHGRRSARLARCRYAARVADDAQLQSRAPQQSPLRPPAREQRRGRRGRRDDGRPPRIDPHGA